MECEIDRQTGAAFTLLHTLCWSVGVKIELSCEARLPVYCLLLLVTEANLRSEKVKVKKHGAMAQYCDDDISV